MDRSAELTANLEALRELMGSAGLDRLVISDHNNVAWIAGGGRSYVSWALEQGAGRVVITPGEAILLTSNIEARRLEVEEFAALPWQIVAHPWWEGPASTLGELVPPHAKVGVDSPLPWLPEATLVGQEIARLRVRLSLSAQDRARVLGRAVGQLLARVCREVQPGETEYEIAGRLTGSLVARGIEVPTCLVAADERLFQWRHFLPTERRLQRYVGLAVCGRKGGLVVSATRLVHFGAPPEEILRRWETVSRIDADLIAATRPGATSGELFEVARTAYAAAGFPEGWRDHHQGGLAGYRAREWFAVPGGADKVEIGQILAWNPSVAGAKSEDTLLVGLEGNEILTDSGDFPCRDVTTSRGTVVRRPEILIR